MFNYLKNFFQRYFFEEEQYAALFIILTFLVFLYFFGGILAPVLISIFFAYMFNGILVNIEKRGFTRLISLSITLLVFFLTYLAIFLILPLISRQIVLLIAEIPQIVDSVNLFFKDLIASNPELSSSNELNQAFSNALSFLPNLIEGVLRQLNSGFSAVMNALLYLIIVPILVFFFLKDKEVFLGYLSSLLPRKRELLSKIWIDLDEQLYGYLKGKGLEMVIVTAITWAIFYIQDVNYAFILASLIGLSVLIPFVGAILVTIPVLLIGLFQWGLETEFYIYFLSYLVIQALDGYVLMPLLLGREVNLHPAVIMVAVLIFGGIWGFWGLLLAVPIATFIRAIYTSWPKKEVEI